LKNLCLLLIFVICMHRIFIIVAGGIDHRYLHRINRDDLQIDPALIALDRFAFFYFVGIHVNRVIAFGTYNSHFFSNLQHDSCSPTHL
jgi:hypothetical protein